MSSVSSSDPDAPLDPPTRLVELLSWAGFAVGALLVLLRYDDLGDEVPIHFGLSGEADDFGPRWSVLPLLALWLVLQAGMSWLARKPHWHNTPVQVTEENRARVHLESSRLLVWTGLSMAVIFLGAVASITGGGSMSWWVVGGLVLMVVVTVVGIVRIVRAGRPRP